MAFALAASLSSRFDTRAAKNKSSQTWFSSLGRKVVRVQQVDAKLACSSLAGVWNSKVFRGRWLRRSAILSSSDCVSRDRSIFLGRYYRCRLWIETAAEYQKITTSAE
jgi:hypothetical protein